MLVGQRCILGNLMKIGQLVTNHVAKVLKIIILKNKNAVYIQFLLKGYTILKPKCFENTGIEVVNTHCDANSKPQDKFKSCNVFPCKAK